MTQRQSYQADFDGGPPEGLAKVLTREITADIDGVQT
jgi:hypothetical protein